MSLTGRLTEIKRYHDGRFEARVSIEPGVPGVPYVLVALDLRCGDYHHLPDAIRQALIRMGSAMGEAFEQPEALIHPTLPPLT